MVEIGIFKNKLKGVSHILKNIQITLTKVQKGTKTAVLSKADNNEINEFIEVKHWVVRSKFVQMNGFERTKTYLDYFTTVVNCKKGTVTWVWLLQNLMH